jgi:hypothetical protein
MKTKTGPAPSPKNVPITPVAVVAQGPTVLARAEIEIVAPAGGLAIGVVVRSAVGHGE